MTKQRIYIIGYMGAGKSGVAKRLAARMGWQSIDTDTLFEEKFRITIYDFFAKYGQDLFRKLEADILRSTANLDKVIVATGGGTPCFFDNMQWMNDNGLTVFLSMSPKSAAVRLSQSKKKRPLTKDLSGDDLVRFVERQYEQRMPFYTEAQMTFKAEDCDVEGIAKNISDALNDSLPCG